MQIKFKKAPCVEDHGCNALQFFFTPTRLPEIYSIKHCIDNKIDYIFRIDDQEVYIEESWL